MNRMALFIVFIIHCFFSQSFAEQEKPYNELYVKQANLKQYPREINSYPPGVEITIGDLHGNALKLLYFLIRNDVIKIDKEDYKLFVNIYQKNPNELTTKDLSFFQIIVNSAEINTQHKIRFLGDDLCDRGMNDYYTLVIYKKLDQANVPFEVILSNHGNFFLTAYERPEQSFNYNPYGEGENESTVQSMLNMGRLIDRGLIDKQDILEMIQYHYLKHIVLPGYTHNKDKNELTIYTHAPIDLEIISALANDLQVPFKDSNLYELTKSLDAINSKIKQWILSNTFTRHYKELNEAHNQTNTPSPIKQILWNRDYSILDRHANPNNKPYGINYVHGHDSMPNVFDLDNLFGKGEDFYQGPYAVHITHS
ncbi:TPA: Dot/Icm T4SS effector WipC [Legionella pneumophila]|nr:Dot/Icm T4SS effector WipC [Legionella pneumophila subsp. pneumophila]HCJ1047600.1 Dot/Icm T4SS effector WipC [Legionella pneumophila]